MLWNHSFTECASHGLGRVLCLTASLNRPVGCFTTECFWHSLDICISNYKNDMLHRDRIATESQLLGFYIRTYMHVYIYIHTDSHIQRHVRTYVHNMRAYAQADINSRRSCPQCCYFSKRVENVIEQMLCHDTFSFRGTRYCLLTQGVKWSHHSRVLGTVGQGFSDRRS
jgi:hypothetical protein